MIYVIIIRRDAQKQAKKLPEKDRIRVIAAIASLQSDPFRGKQLHGDLDGAWVIRVWPYRIVYTIEKKIITVTVLRIGHRNSVYK